MTAKPIAFPDLRAKIAALSVAAQRRADHFEGAATATIDTAERSRLEFLQEHWTGRLQGLTEALAVLDLAEMGE